MLMGRTLPLSFSPLHRDHQGLVGPNSARPSFQAITKGMTLLQSIYIHSNDVVNAWEAGSHGLVPPSSR
jgi:hypothetical protein